MSLKSIFGLDDNRTDAQNVARIEKAILGIFDLLEQQKRLIAILDERLRVLEGRSP